MSPAPATGTVIVTVVPRPTTEVISAAPPTRVSRPRILTSIPRFCPRSASGLKPLPLSRIVTLAVSPLCVTSIDTSWDWAWRRTLTTACSTASRTAILRSRRSPVSVLGPLHSSARPRESTSLAAKAARGSVCVPPTVSESSNATASVNVPGVARAESASWASSRAAASSTGDRDRPARSSAPSTLS